MFSSDEGSKTDIPAWVMKAKHDLVEVVDDNGYAHFISGKGEVKSWLLKF